MDLASVDTTQRKLIVGIDLGTTYSGVAWAESRDPSKIAIVTTWPISEQNREAQTSGKCPTKLRYATDTTVQWGFSIPPTADEKEVIEWFKLDLDSSKSLKDRSRSKDAARNGRSPEVLVADYLKAFSEHLIYMLRRRLGNSIVDTVPIEWVITVPAIWSESAKDKTLRAARKAPSIEGKPVHLVSEPEAAALYTLHHLDPHGLTVGDTFVTVDAGGGTVDLISYTITQLEPILAIEETAPGSGGLCGSSFLNERFAFFMRHKLGHLKNFDDDLMGPAMELFETKVKRHFTTATGSEERFVIPAGGLANNKRLGILRGRFSLLGSDVRAIFAPVVRDIVDLVNQQIKQTSQPVKAVMLIGGFGASTYLRERVAESIGGDIEILQPAEAWTAVVRGAVLKGLAINSPRLAPVTVRKRRARKSYGIELASRFDSGLHSHLNNQKYWCRMDRLYKLKVMKWFIKRGDVVSEDEPVCIPVQVDHPHELGAIETRETSILCDYAHRELGNTIVQRDRHIRHLATLTSDLSLVPLKDIKIRIRADGNWYKRYRYEIRATFFSALTQYDLWYGEKNLGSVTCEYV